MIDAAQGNPGEIVYVGDHRDNDLVPAKAAGLRTAHIGRCPWGTCGQTTPASPGWRTGASSP